MTVRTIYLWPALAQAPKYYQIAELLDQLDWTSDTLGVKIPMVATPLLLKCFATLGVRMRDLEDLTRGVQPFSLSQHTTAQRKSAATAAETYFTVVG